MLGEQGFGLVYVIREWLELENGWSGAERLFPDTLHVHVCFFAYCGHRPISAWLTDTMVFYWKRKYLFRLSG